jgi:hypothetical protein
MTHLASIAALTGVLGPLLHGGGSESLGTWKAVLATLLLVVALVQAGNQAIGRSLARQGREQAQHWIGLHRWLGSLALLLVLVLVGLGLYGSLALMAPLDSAARMAHAILGGLLAVLLLVKAAISNRFRARLYVNVWLGVTTLLLVIAIWCISALPHLIDLAGMAAAVSRVAG